MKLAVDGRTAYAYTGGKPFDPALPCVVLLHGALNDHSVWGLQSRYLAHHGRAVLAVDLPGPGRSDGPALESVEAMADWLLALLDAAGVERAALVGHSMGSLIGLHAAGQAPQRASRLVMVGTAYPMAVSPALLATARDAPQRAIEMVNVFEHSTFAAKPAAPGPGAWLHGGALALKRRIQAGYAERHGGNLFQIDFGACNAYARGLEAAARVGCPVRLVLGSKDAMTAPKAAGELARVLRAETLLLPAGHSLMTEAPDGVLNAIVGFVPAATEEER
jgi:pimeloyl-ACP methyl ester carboxylesterase